MDSEVPARFVEMIPEETKTKNFTVLSCLFSFLLNISLHQNTNNIPNVINSTCLRLSVNGILFLRSWIFEQFVSEFSNAEAAK